MEQPNLPHWEALAAFHGRGDDRYYDLDALVGGASSLTDLEERAVEAATYGHGVKGQDVLHLQCHLGLDAVTLARRGARVTATDFSPTALSRLDELAERCSVAVRTVLADSRDLPSELDQGFDLVYATIGVLCWIDDLAAWMTSVARVLRPGGALCLVELHPLLTCVESRNPLVLDFPYLDDGPHRFDTLGSYANPDAPLSSTTLQWAHGLGEVVSAALGAGLTLAHLTEHVEMAFDPVGWGLEPDGRFRLRLGAGDAEGRTPAVPLPVAYTLIARR